MELRLYSLNLSVCVNLPQLQARTLLWALRAMSDVISMFVLQDKLERVELPWNGVSKNIKFSYTPPGHLRCKNS